MSKVYILCKRIQSNPTVICGAVLGFEAACGWERLDSNYFYIKTELNDPELLNRIAKESERKN